MCMGRALDVVRDILNEIMILHVMLNPCIWNASLWFVLFHKNQTKAQEVPKICSNNVPEKKLSFEVHDYINL